MAIAIVSRMTGVTGRLDIAKELSESVLSDRSATPALVMYAKAGLALVAVQNGDRSTAGELHAYFLGQRGTMLWTAISVDRLLGLLSHAMGDPGQSAAHFEDALAFCRNAAYGPELARTCSDYAECLLNASTVSGKSEPGNSANTTVLLDEALAISSDLGMRPLNGKGCRLTRANPSPARRRPGLCLRADPAGGGSPAAHSTRQNHPGDRYRIGAQRPNGVTPQSLCKRRR